MSPPHQWYGVVPGWLPFYALIVAAGALFAWRVAYLVRLMLTGKPAARWDNVPARVSAVGVFVLGQLRLLRHDFWPGLMHATIFWGFIILTVGTLEFFGKGMTESFFLPFLSDTPAYLILQDVFDLAVIVAVAYALFRRLVTRPARLTLSTEGLVILLLIFALMVTDLFADASRILLAPGPGDRWSFAGSALAARWREDGRWQGLADYFARGGRTFTPRCQCVVKARRRILVKIKKLAALEAVEMKAVTVVGAPS